MNEFTETREGDLFADGYAHVPTAISSSGILATIGYDRPRRPARPWFYKAYGKRAIDITITLTVLPILIVLVGLVILAVWCQGGAPIYTQNRIGRHGRVFRMFKIRSMMRDADARLAAHLDACPEVRREWDVHQKLRCDPRITRLGRFIRKTSIDELPQFLNVLLGDMSLIGPRPFMEDQQGRYPGTSYYAMRPGLSGLWQITERSESTFEERAAYDEAYFRRMSFAEDMRIVAGTFRVLIRPSGV